MEKILIYIVYNDIILSPEIFLKIKINVKLLLERYYVTLHG